MRILNRSCGILAGPTSGASYLGALNYLQNIDNALDQDTPIYPATPKKKAVFIVCDRLEWYVSYIEKRKPEWFGGTQKESSIRSYKAPVDMQEFEISVTEAQEWIGTHNPLIIDTRGALGYKTMQIAGSINIPDKKLIELFDDGIPLPPNKPILFVCPSGNISKLFAGFLLELNKKKNNKQDLYDAKSLQGGLLAWKQAGFPLEK